MHEAKIKKWLTKAQLAWARACSLKRPKSRSFRFCTLAIRLRSAWAT